MQDAHIIRFSYRELVQKSNQYIRAVRAETGESVGKINGFSSKVSLSGCTMHTHIHRISQIHTPGIIVSFSLWQLKKFFGEGGEKKKRRKKKLSLRRLIALIFNLAFTRAYSGCGMLVELHVRSVGLWFLKSVAEVESDFA